MAVLKIYTTEYQQDIQTSTTFPWIAQRTTNAVPGMWSFALPAIPVAGDATSVVYLRRLPPGLVWFFPPYSYFAWTAFGAGRTLTIGYGSYQSIALLTVAASPAIFDAAINVAAAGQATLGSSYTQALQPNVGGKIAFTSSKGVDIIATVAGGTIPVGTQLTGVLQVAEPGV